MPFELRPYPHPTVRPEDNSLQSAWSQSVYPLARTLGVAIHLPSVSPQPYTRLAHEGLEFAKEHGTGNEYSHAVLAAFFQHSQDIGQLGVLTRIAASVGLNASDFRSALEQGRYQQRTEELQRHAQRQGITALPTFFIGRRRLSGLYPAEVLAQAIAEESNPAG
jgi:predicted DsbA family dithiol-disulfide isomerase